MNNMKQFKKYLLLLPLVALTSCGYALDYIVKGNTYNSPVFKENYYTNKDVSLNNAKDGEIIEVNNFITDINDISSVDSNFADKTISSEEYGQKYKMNLVDNLFNYGVQSKLFDGQMVCGAQNGHPELAYQLARVQTNPDGFAIRFSKESSELDYFVLQFKATTDRPTPTYKLNSYDEAVYDRDIFHDSIVHLNINLYTKDNDGIKKNTFKSTIEIGNNKTNNGSFYIFYAFSFKTINISLSRVVGFGLDFTYEDDLVEWNKNQGVNLDYALMLYEMFLPNTTWQ